MIELVDEKIKQKLSKLLSNVSTEKLSAISDMIKNGEDIESKIDMDKASKLLKSLNIDDSQANELIKTAKEELKKNPDILSKLK